MPDRLKSKTTITSVSDHWRTLPDTQWQRWPSGLITTPVPHLWIKLFVPPTVRLALCQNWLSEERWAEGPRYTLSPDALTAPRPTKNPTSGSVFPTSSTMIESEEERHNCSQGIWSTPLLVEGEQRSASEQEAATICISSPTMYRTKGTHWLAGEITEVHHTGQLTGEGLLCLDPERHKRWELKFNVHTTCLKHMQCAKSIMYKWHKWVKPHIRSSVQYKAGQVDSTSQPSRGTEVSVWTALL